MHAAFMQFSFKFNMLHCRKLQLMRYSTKRGKQNRSKNHYDTLNITPQATQTEVKSAYYKLSLQYHPDKNKTEHAKQKFQDISEAYEVLGNHEQRKVYDRSMLLQQQPTMSTTATGSKSYYRDHVYSGSSKIYNFDAWTQAHYGKQINSKRIRREQYELNKKMEDIRNQANINVSTIRFCLFILTTTMLVLFFSRNHDIPKRKIQNGNNRNS